MTSKFDELYSLKLKNGNPVTEADIHRLREIHRGMVRRASSGTHSDARHYLLERRISVCDEWTVPGEGVLNFCIWAITKGGYYPGSTLDRVANGRPYRPNNCRFISRKAQAYNRSTNRRIRIGNEVHTLEEWSRRTNVPPDVIKHREERGWSIEEAILTPVGQKRMKKDEGA